MNQQDVLEWIQKGLESSCQINILINANKMTKNNQFNYFHLGTQLMVKTKKIEATARFLPNYFKFIRTDSRLSSLEEDSMNRARTINKSQNNNMFQNLIYGKSTKEPSKLEQEKLNS